SGESGHSYHQSTIDSIQWESVEKKDRAESTVVKGAKTLSEAELSAAIEKLFIEIDDLIDNDDYDGLLGRFEKLRQLMTLYGGLGTKISQEKLRAWVKKSNGTKFADVQKALQLQVFVSRGNKILREMSAHLRDQRNGQVIRGFFRIEKLCAEMKAHKAEIFTRNAKALYERAKELKDKAAKNLKNK
ncbi:MAG: hypothetical protein P1V97_13570, partial [Planctomycetota bacterium]|nr:hypothetical protein [Planctomycetota bacterium]